MRGKIFRALIEIVLRPFHGMREGAASSCDHSLHHAMGCAKCWREFRSVEHREAPAGSGAHVEKASSMLKGVRDCVHRACNWGKRTRDGLGYRRVFAMNRAQNFGRGFGVNSARSRIPLLGCAWRAHSLVAPASCLQFFSILFIDQVAAKMPALQNLQHSHVSLTFDPSYRF